MRCIEARRRSPVQIAFIDPSLEAWEILATGVKKGIEVIVLDPVRDAVEQITAALGKRSGVEAIHIICHGSPGALHLGETTINARDLDRYAPLLQSVGSVGRGGSVGREKRIFTSHPSHPSPSLSMPPFPRELGGIQNLILYGCQVAAGEIGRAFVEKLHQLTGANIAASSSPVGNPQLGGNWELDAIFGKKPAVKMAFSAKAMAAYPAVLAASFASQTTFGAGNQPVSVAVGDFNGDSKDDLAVANFSGNSLSVLLGDGSGSFGTQTTYAAGAQARSVAVGDFNGDGKKDLAVANQTDGNVSVLLGDGSGGFGTQTTFGAGALARSIAVGDFNGDGKDDLAVGNYDDGNVSVLLGDGNGSFGTQTTFGAGSGPRSVAVGDFNGDGKKDLAVANQGDNNVSVLQGDGSGGFGTQTVFATGSAPESVAVGDFNGDGKDDLAVANRDSDNVSVLLGDGSGSFGTQTNFAVGDRPRYLVVGDLNGDSILDLAVANSNDANISVLLGDGSGSFGTQTTFAVGGRPVSVAISDFNGDGKNDLSVANSNNGNISVLLQGAAQTSNNPPVVASSVFFQGLGFHNGGQFSFAADSYTDSDPGDSVTYSIAVANTLSYSWYTWTRGANGGRYRKPKEGIVFPEVPLPSWLTFDPATRTINIDEASRPNRFRYGMKIIGTDSSGESVSEFIWFKSSAAGGFIIDNYIAGATVFWDANKNGIQDAGEPSTTSDQTGEFDLNITIGEYDTNNNGILDPEEGQIVAIGGIDTATGLPLETPVITAPESTVATLLTTLVADLINKGLNVNEANERVVAALSLPSGVDLNSLDPIAASQNNEPGGVETLAAMAKVQNAITQAAKLIDGASNADFNAIVQDVVGAITSQIQTGGTLDPNNSATLETIINNAAEATRQDDPNINLARVQATASGAAQVIAQSNQQVDAAIASGATGTALTARIADVQKISLGQTTQDLKDAGEGTKSIAEVVVENTALGLQAQINSTAPVPLSLDTPPLVAGLPTLLANIELVLNDATEGTESEDTYIGDDRDNSYLAYSGNDILSGNGGNDWMNGNTGDDSLDGGNGNDTLYGGKDNDTISGNNGADVIFGNRGNDSLLGNNGDDFINGNQAEDILFGGNGNDLLYGGKENDTLNGGDGSDTMSGDLGNDILNGGNGGDRFVLKAGYGSDILTDFEDGQDFLALADGLSFEQLAITGDFGSTLIRFEDELLATLENVDVSLISSGDFLAFS